MSPVGSKLKYAIRSPSGDQEGVPAMSSFGSAVMPVPSTLMMCSTEFLVNASRVPSGDHVGPSSNAKSSGPGSGVTCCRPVPSALMMEIRPIGPPGVSSTLRSEEHTSELQSLAYLVCRLLLEKKKIKSNRDDCQAVGGFRAVYRETLSRSHF